MLLTISHMTVLTVMLTGFYAPNLDLGEGRHQKLVLVCNFSAYLYQVNTKEMDTRVGKGLFQWKTPISAT